MLAPLLRREGESFHTMYQRVKSAPMAVAELDALIAHVLDHADLYSSEEPFIQMVLYLRLDADFGCHVDSPWRAAIGRAFSQRGFELTMEFSKFEATVRAAAS